MNFLAHIYLSGNHEKIMVGNFIGDYVKGTGYLKYPEEISRGILLHRSIDFYTDNHPLVRQSKKRIDARYRKYAGIVIDIFYDYFLASHWLEYSRIPLHEFTSEVYVLLNKHYDIFPSAVKSWFPTFIRNNGLMSCASVEGTQNVLHRMSGRTSLPEYTDYAIAVLKKERQGLEAEFHEFFACIREYVDERFGIKTGCPFEAA